MILTMHQIKNIMEAHPSPANCHKEQYSIYGVDVQINVLYPPPAKYLIFRCLCDLYKYFWSKFIILNRYQFLIALNLQ